MPDPVFTGSVVSFTGIIQRRQRIAGFSGFLFSLPQKQKDPKIRDE